MAAILDNSDVPQVAPKALALPMQEMIDAGRGLVLLRGIQDRELRQVEHAVWDRLEGTSSDKVATLLRFRCLVGVFAGARLQELFLRRGLTLVPLALEVAADMRLNVQWGFNPVKFTRALEARLAELDQRRSARRMERAVGMQAAQAAQAAMA
jgi:hypothetical protein